MIKGIFVRNLIKSYLKKKVMIILCVVIFTAAIGGFGFTRAYPSAISSEFSDEVEEYNNALAIYDSNIQLTQDNIASLEKQVEQQQAYCDESIYMQIDPSDVKTATVQYVIQAEGDSQDAINTTVTYVLNNWNAYINSGSMRNTVASALDNDPPVQYLSELITVATSGNTLTVSVKHYDMDKASAILEEIKQCIEDRKSVVEQAVGSYTMTELSTSETAAADLTVQNTQNTNLTTLRTYKNNLTDFQTKLVTQQTTRKNYEQQYKPTGVTTSSPKKTLVEYGGIGVIAGLVVPFVLYALYYTLSGRLKNKEELMSDSLNIIGTYHGKKGYLPGLERIILDIRMMSEQKGSSVIHFVKLGESKNLTKVAEELSGCLPDSSLEAVTVLHGEESLEEMESMAEDGNCVLITEAGVSRYTDIEEQLQFCKRYHVSVWGCIVIE